MMLHIRPSKTSPCHLSILISHPAGHIHIQLPALKCWVERWLLDLLQLLLLPKTHCPPSSPKRTAHLLTHECHPLYEALPGSPWYNQPFPPVIPGLSRVLSHYFLHLLIHMSPQPDCRLPQVISLTHSRYWTILTGWIKKKTSLIMSDKVQSALRIQGRNYYCCSWLDFNTHRFTDLALGHAGV